MTDLGKDILSSPCPICESTGPHERAEDHPDPGHDQHTPLTCANCSYEFIPGLPLPPYTS